MSSPTSARPDGHGPVALVVGTLGVAVMAYGVVGLVGQAGAQGARSVGAWVVGADLVHDLVLAPLAIAVGWTVGRVVPGVARAPVQLGLMAAGVVTLVAYAPLRGTGHATVPDNPSVQPLDYPTAAATILVGIALAVAGTVAIRVVLRHRTRRRTLTAPP